MLLWCFAAAAITRVSQFQRPIDVEALAAQYNAGDMVEDDDWHEDTYEWRDKVREKHAKPLDMNDLQAGGPIDPVAIQAAAGGMKMIFTTLRKEAVHGGHWCAINAAKRIADERLAPGATECREESIRHLARRWQQMLRTDGLEIRVSVLDAYQLLVIDDDGRRLVELKDFVLAQPEALSMRIDSQDYYAPGLKALPVKAKPAPKKKTMKRKKKKKKRRRRRRTKKHHEQSAGGSNKAEL
jgi:hypothetical protein